VYTADAYGKLSTTSNAANMATAQMEPDTLAMSPKGFYLAAAGFGDDPAVGPDGGIQLFLMHGSKPLTALSGVILPGVSNRRDLLGQQRAPVCGEQFDGGSFMCST
jgi:hypothetical protein